MNELITLEKEYKKLIEGDTFDLDKFNEFAIVHHSNEIEGSTLTKEETFLLLDENLTPKNKPLEHTFMALDHLRALKYVIALANKKELLTVDIIKNISALLMKNTGSPISAMGGDFDSSKGDFRKVTVRAGTQTFIDYKKVPGEVEAFVNYINENINKVKNYKEINDLAFDSHYQMVTIHPFADGNGRLSRLLMNYVQQYHNTTLSIIYQTFKSDYFKALTETRKDKNVKVFRKFMYQQTKIRLKKLIQNIGTKKEANKNRGRETGFSFLF